MAENCERCEQLTQLAQAYQQALRNTYMTLMVALQPDTSNELRAEILAELQRGATEAQKMQEGPSDAPPTPLM